MIHTITLNPALDKTVEVPGFFIDKVNRVTAIQVYAGGKGINVSKVLYKLGQPNVAQGLLGGEAGAATVRQMTSMGILHDFVRISGETRTNLKVVDPQNKTYTDFNVPGPTKHRHKDRCSLQATGAFLDYFL